MAAPSPVLLSIPEKYSENEGKKENSNAVDKVANKINKWVVLGFFLVISAIGAITLGSLGLFSVVPLINITSSKIILASGISCLALSFFAFYKAVIKMENDEFFEASKQSVKKKSPPKGEDEAFIFRPGEYGDVD